MLSFIIWSSCAEADQIDFGAIETASTYIGFGFRVERTGFPPTFEFCGFVVVGGFLAGTVCLYCCRLTASEPVFGDATFDGADCSVGVEESMEEDVALGGRPNFGR